MSRLSRKRHSCMSLFNRALPFNVWASLLFLLLVTGCSLSPADKERGAEEPFAGIQNGQLVYKGKIIKEKLNQLFNAYENADEKPTRLVISSTGGELSLGMDFGEWVYHHQLDVEVAGVCASSCANYVLPAGRIKYLNKDSALVWHGSAWQEDWEIEDEWRAEFSDYLIRMREKESRLLAKLEVDNVITVYGQLNFGFWDFTHSVIKGGYIGYDYSLDDMRRFGLSDIVLIDDEWDWRQYHPDHRDRVNRVTVEEDYEFTINRFGVAELPESSRTAR